MKGGVLHGLDPGGGGLPLHYQLLELNRDSLGTTTSHVVALLIVEAERGENNMIIHVYTQVGYLRQVFRQAYQGREIVINLLKLLVQIWHTFLWNTRPDHDRLLAGHEV